MVGFSLWADKGGGALWVYTLHYPRGYRFFSHFQAECWQVRAGRRKECVSLPQVKEPTSVTHLCFTVSVSLAVFVLVSLACKCYCCSWECLNETNALIPFPGLVGFFVCFIFCSCLWEQAKEDCVCVCLCWFVRAFIYPFCWFEGFFFESFLCSIISIVCCSWSALERKLCFMDFLQVCCWSSLLGFCFKTNALDSCQNIARKKIATENSSSVLLEMHQSTGETTDSSMGLMHSDPPQNLLLLPLYLF